MSIEPGLKPSEFELQMRPKPLTTPTPETNCKLASKGTYDEDMVGTEDKSSGAKIEDITDGEVEVDDDELSSISYDKDEEEADDEASDKHGVDEYDSEGVNRHVLMTRDESHILSPNAMTIIPLPIDDTEKKKKKKKKKKKEEEALLSILLPHSKLAYFDNGGHITLAGALSLIPKWLWWPLFSHVETFHILEDQEKTSLKGMLAKLWIAMEQWKTLPGYPATPASWLEIELAKSEEQRARRTVYFKSLLEEQGPVTDGWIESVFEDFKSAVEFDGLKFDEILESDDDDMDRERLVSQLALLAEVCFVHLIIRRAENQLSELSGEEPIQSMIDTLLQISCTHGWLQSSRPQVVIKQRSPDPLQSEKDEIV